MVTRIDKINEKIGKGVSWLSVLLVIVIIIDVLLRYLFSITSAASFELEWHLFAALFLVVAGWTLQQERHVRVDVFYQNFGEKGKA
jgi:TRAP-type mannitol/chloroaromatic compound transport system permease small subunit